MNKPSPTLATTGTLLRSTVLLRAGLLTATTLGLTLKYIVDGSAHLSGVDLGFLFFSALMVIFPIVPFLAAGAVGLWRQESPLLVACLIFEGFALASCWYYFRLAFHLAKPDSLDALTFIFLPIYQLIGLGVLLGLGTAWHRWRGKA